MKTVSELVRKERLDICNSCELLNKSLNTCKSCGCFMPAKATFANSTCPENKWDKAEPGDSLINKIEDKILDIWNR